MAIATLIMSCICMSVSLLNMLMISGLYRKDDKHD